MKNMNLPGHPDLRGLILCGMAKVALVGGAECLTVSFSQRKVRALAQKIELDKGQRHPQDRTDRDYKLNGV